ncbi:MAG: hypothetical protein IJ215_04030 [Clostridia bacterium]|nr:hypothetical protein [Clostridia bacterium]
MPPKFIIIKMHSKIFFRLLVRELTNYHQIHFLAKKINGVYTVMIKCQKYYDCLNMLSAFPSSSISKSSNIYLSYIYLYTCISMILSELMIRFYEGKITRQILTSKYSYLSAYELFRFSNLTHAVLDSNFPSIDAKKLYLYRKELILNRLLLNFRNRNYMDVDYFAYFKLSDYHNHLEDIIEKTYSRY